MATRLQNEYPGGVVEKNYREKYLIEQPENAIFEALHRKTEADFIKSVGGFVIGVDAEITIRYDRIAKRQEGEKDRVSFEKFKEDARIEDEGGGDSTRDNNIRSVLSGADVVIENNGTLKELQRQVDEALRALAFE